MQDKDFIMATGSEHWRRDGDVFLPGAEAVGLCSHSLSGTLQ